MIEYEVISSPRGDVPNVQPGDIGLVHDWKEDWVGELIQAGERATYGHTAWSNITHSFAVMDNTGVIFQVNEELICSAHVSYGMLAYETDLPVPYQTMKPADIGTMTGLDLGEPPMPLSFWGRCLDKLRLVSNLLSRPFR